MIAFWIFQGVVDLPLCIDQRYTVTTCATIVPTPRPSDRARRRVRLLRRVLHLFTPTPTTSRRVLPNRSVPIYNCDTRILDSTVGTYRLQVLAEQSRVRGRLAQAVSVVGVHIWHGHRMRLVQLHVRSVCVYGVCIALLKVVLFYTHHLFHTYVIHPLP
jgi:hypothetical protein